MSEEVLIAGAQARRDRARLAAAWTELTGLRRQLDDLAGHPILRLVRRARRPASPTPLPSSGRGMALVIDHNWPLPERDAGSVEIVTLLGSLRRLGFDTVLAASRQHGGEQPARDALEALGIRCLRPSDAASLEAYLAEHGRGIDLCVLCRVYCGGEFLEQAERDCPTARLVFDSIDLNYLREERKAAVLGDPVLAAAAQQARLREEHVIRRCDATLVVSAAEAALLAERQPDCLVVQMPLARTVTRPATPFAQRRGIGFIGGFAHAPNVDAVRHFLAEIWPLVRRDLPDCPLSIVGADAPAGLLDGVAGPVRLLGPVADIGPWFESLRLSIAPLRFGAGAKGKVASSLAAGVPCVATPMAAEGMTLDGAGVLVAATPAEFAAAISHAHEDGALWDRLSAEAVAYASRTLAPEAWQARLDGTLRRLGL